jgi:hypothetical protein
MSISVNIMVSIDFKIGLFAGRCLMNRLVVSEKRISTFLDILLFAASLLKSF